MKSLTPLKRTGLAILVALSVTGCFSFKSTPDPTQFYVLSPVAEDKVDGVRGGVALCILGVAIPKYVDVPWLVTREEGNRIRRIPFHQWAEDISDGVSRAVVGNLATALDTSDILVMARERAGESRFFVRLTIARFDLTSAGEASIAASWRIRNSAAPEFELNNRIERTAMYSRDAADFGSAVDALNGLLAEVCASVADDIANSGLIR